MEPRHQWTGQHLPELLGPATSIHGAGMVEKSRWRSLWKAGQARWWPASMASHQEDDWTWSEAKERQGRPHRQLTDRLSLRSRKNSLERTRVSTFVSHHIQPQPSSESNGCFLSTFQTSCNLSLSGSISYPHTDSWEHSSSLAKLT